MATFLFGFAACVLLLVETQAKEYQLVTFNAGLQPDGSIAAWQERKGVLIHAVGSFSNLRTGSVL